MENNDITILVNSFKQYRDLLTPIEKNLRDFSETYQNLKDDIQKLNSAFGGNIQEKLDKIYKDLSSQAEKSKNLASEIDRFSSSTKKYVEQVDRFTSLSEGLESRLKAVDEIQRKAENQIDKLNVIIEEKKKTYDIKQLEKNLENYNVSVQKVSQFINKDIAEVLKNNNEKINEIRDKNDSVLINLLNEKESIEKLVESYKSSNQLLKKVVENEAINEEYIFEILDRWAEDRKVKTKK